MSTTHTPGPWFIPRAPLTRGGSGDTSVWALGGDVIISESPSRSLSLEGRRANARLIAAAPELLDALKALSDKCSSHLGDSEWCVSDEVSDAQAIIRKATGADQ